MQQIDIFDVIFDLQILIRKTPLTEDERKKYKNNIQVITQMAQEWVKLQDNAEKNK